MEDAKYFIDFVGIPPNIGKWTGCPLLHSVFIHFVKFISYVNYPHLLHRDHLITHCHLHNNYSVFSYLLCDLWYLQHIDQFLQTKFLAAYLPHLTGQQLLKGRICMCTHHQHGQPNPSGIKNMLSVIIFTGNACNN